MSSPEILSIGNDSQRLGVIPSLGASTAFWDVHRDGAWHPIWRPYAPAQGHRRILANCLLLPWSNRLTGGGIHVDGTFYPMEPNRPDSDVPMHGTGWMHHWQVALHEAGEILLTVEAGHPCGYPWHYRASQLYRIAGDTMTMRLEITHLGAKRLPYGLGFHPYILRNPGGPEVKLQFKAGGYWEAENNLPVRHSETLPSDWNFSTLRDLGHGRIDHNFTGCDGRMAMERPDLGLHIDWLTTEPAGLDLAIFYRPEHDEWFCYEPVTHITDAFNRPGMPGLRLLEQGESMALEVRQTLSWIES